MAEKSRSRPVAPQPTVSRPELMVDNSDQAFRQFIHDTLAFSARLQQVRSLLGQVIGLSGTQYTVLIAIAHLGSGDERVGVNLVADHLHFSGAFITIAFCLIPLSLAFGTILVIGLYLLANVAYLAALPFTAIQKSRSSKMRPCADQRSFMAEDA